MPSPCASGRHAVGVLPAGAHATSQRRKRFCVSGWTCTVVSKLQPSPATFTRTGQVKKPTGPSFGGTTGTTPVKPSGPGASAIAPPNVQPPLAGMATEAVFTASATVPERPSVMGRENGAWLRPPATARNAAFQGCGLTSKPKARRTAERRSRNVPAFRAARSASARRSTYSGVMCAPVRFRYGVSTRSKTSLSARYIVSW